MASVRNDASIIIDEVKRTLAGHSDMSMVTRYLEMSKDELTAILSQGEITLLFQETYFTLNNLN